MRQQGKKKDVCITRENNHEMCKACAFQLKRNQAGAVTTHYNGRGKAISWMRQSQVINVPTVHSLLVGQDGDGETFSTLL